MDILASIEKEISDMTLEILEAKTKIANMTIINSTDA